MIKAFHMPISATVPCRRAYLEGGGKGAVDVPVRYGVVEHETHGPILIDTGYTDHLRALPGLAALAYRTLLSPKFRSGLQPVPFLRSLGYTPADVRHVIVTHLHADHASGLEDFSHATFHNQPRRSIKWKPTELDLDDLNKPRLKRIAKAMGIASEVAAFMAEVRDLNRDDDSPYHKF